MDEVSSHLRFLHSHSSCNMLSVCARHAVQLRRTTCRAFLRYMSTEEEPMRLRTQEDWHDFQLRRAEQETLGAFQNSRLLSKHMLRTIYSTYSQNMAQCRQALSKPEIPFIILQKKPRSRPYWQRVLTSATPQLE
jgi:hypothetical protein